MRILAIRGKNLASLEGVFEIDFTEEPLKSAGLFAITGSTGSGKSTILDALCLALFDDTPRFRNANSGDITDVSGKALNQRSSANILRKGTGEGYAEVDFMALTGGKYRSRWSIKRARGRFNGTLQNAEMSILNLDDNSYLQGNKTELLSKIVELIGLSFNQFTRAVLLAQGDFATFMKANDSEKAEILEKLTGTDVYSRISVGVYERFKVAEGEYREIGSRISNVRLLGDEELAELRVKKDRVGNQILEVRKEEKVAERNLEWKRMSIALSEEIKETERELIRLKTGLDEAKPRFDYMAKLDRVQEIRDVFNRYRDFGNQITDTESKLELKSEELKLASDRFALAENEYKENEERHRKITERYEEITPQIKEARSLDIMIGERNKSVSGANDELRAANEKRGELEKVVDSLRSEIAKYKDRLAKCEQWLEEHRIYADVVAKNDLISKLLRGYKQIKEEIEANEKRAERCNELLGKDEALLTDKQKYLDSLNDVLPDEVVILRRRLVDGEPCPVCGSLHHLSFGSTEHELRMKDEQLEGEKEGVKQQIEMLLKSVGDVRTEAKMLEAAKLGYLKRMGESADELSGYLVKAMPDWKARIEEQRLESELQKLTEQWHKVVEAKKDAESMISLKTENLKLQVANLEEMTKGVVEREERLTKETLQLDELKQKRRLLIKGKDVDEVENSYKSELEKYGRSKEELLSKRTNLSNGLQNISGEIKQMNSLKEKLALELVELKKAIDSWIDGTEGFIDYPLLKEMLSKSVAWIEQERGRLLGMRDEVLSTESKLSERRTRLITHGNSRDRVDDESTIADLEERVRILTERVGEMTSNYSDLELELKTDDRNRAEVAGYVKELKVKRKVYENWAKINDLFGSASGDKFKKIAQCYTLDALLSFANKHLELLSKRYRLERISNSMGDGLGLQVIDEYMYGDVRGVHTLSGGESFLISLALALGLSSLSSNRMSIESLFIDEGFGSLDMETLRVAMSALETLQTQGRKIGVISHVQEMTEQIRVKIKVNKIANGRSGIEVSDGYCQV